MIENNNKQKKIIKNKKKTQIAQIEIYRTHYQCDDI